MKYHSVLFGFVQLLTSFTAVIITEGYLVPNPCLGFVSVAPFFSINMLSKRGSRHRSQSQVLRDVLRDLDKTIQTTSFARGRIENYLDNVLHLRHLVNFESNISLAWQPFTLESSKEMLYNMYDGLQKAAILTNHTYHEIQPMQNIDMKDSFHHLILLVDQGNGSGGGIYNLLCTLFRYFTEKVALVNYDNDNIISKELFANGSPSKAVDIAYQCITNVEGLLKGLKAELVFFRNVHQ